MGGGGGLRERLLKSQDTAVEVWDVRLLGLPSVFGFGGWKIWALPQRPEETRGLMLGLTRLLGSQRHLRSNRIQAIVGPALFRPYDLFGASAQWREVFILWWCLTLAVPAKGGVRRPRSGFILCAVDEVS